MTLASLKSHRIFYLIFSTATLLILGLLYAWSIFASPIGRTYPNYIPLLSQVFQVAMFSFCISELFAAEIIKRTSLRLTIIIAALLMGAGFVFTAFASGVGVWALFLFYGVLAAAGCGIAYVTIVTLVNPWFPDKIGFCSGVQMMGFGVSSLILGSLANAMFAVIDWTLVFLIIAFVSVTALVSLAFVIRPAPTDIALRLGLKGAAATVELGATRSQSIMKTKVFWVYCVWATALIACGLTVIGSAKQGAEVLGLDPGFAALLVGLISTMNGLSRIINGVFFDKIGLTPVMILSSILATLAMTCLAFSFFSSVQIVYIVAAILVAMPYGSVPVMASAFARQRYRPSDFAKNFGIVSCTVASASLVNITIVLLLGSPVGVNAPIVFSVLAILAIIALVAALIFNKFYSLDLVHIAEEVNHDST
jgi:OFA family oxalate/formate antiporter-like MFS transporter